MKTNWTITKLHENRGKYPLLPTCSAELDTIAIIINDSDYC